eukprot:s3934_g3.t1
MEKSLLLWNLESMPRDVDMEDRCKMTDPVVRAHLVNTALAKVTNASKNKKSKKGEPQDKETKKDLRIKRKAAAHARAWLTPKDRKLERAQYLQALRRSMSQGVRLCVSTDASRIGGRKRSNWAVLNLSSGAAGWAPPQVHADILNDGALRERDSVSSFDKATAQFIRILA